MVTAGTEDALVAGVRAGDEAVFAKLLTDWSRPMMLLARTFVSTEASAIDALPHRQRVVITLRDVLGHSSDEVCQMLEISGANQLVLLHRARAVVRSRLAPYLEGDPTASADEWG